ncbi:YybH family protein [Hyphococcus sp.]|jgi:ketosteroid isomerase-like protein|uniref:YybH family protein n=1 Tax=Hyphococcus sp. TaxID=2038636 RepID=UPI003D1209C5
MDKMKNLVAGAAFAVAAIISVAHADPVEEMLDADSAFAAMAQEDGVPTAFAAYAAEDVRMFPEGSASYTGRAALIERFATWPEGATLEWTPMTGAAASSGDFGYTWGTYVFTAPGEDGDTSSYGKYVSIWRKDGGEWKFIADIGNQGPAPEPAD